MADLGRYFVLVRLASADMEKSKAIFDELSRISAGNIRSVITTKDADVFGFFLSSQRPASAIRNALRDARQNLGERDVHTIPAILRAGDAAFIAEIGSDFAEIGFQAAAAWLQHH